MVAVAMAQHTRFEECRCRILELATDDYHGLYELVRARARPSDDDFEAAKTETLLAVTSLLHDGLISVYRRDGTFADERLLPRTEAFEVLREPRSWRAYQSHDETQIVIASTPLGDRSYFGDEWKPRDAP